MRLAYLAYDKNSLKAHSILKETFSVIDTYLISTEISSFDDGHLNLLNLPIMIQNVYIPGNESLQTMQHKLILHKIKNEFNFLKQNIFSKYKLSKEEFSGKSSEDFNEDLHGDLDEAFDDVFDEEDENSSENSNRGAAIKRQKTILASLKNSKVRNLSLNAISDLHFNKKTGLYVIQSNLNNEISKEPEKPEKIVFEYDYLIVENHQLVSQALLTKSQNVIKQLHFQSHVVLNLEFPLQYKLHKQYLYHDFIFIENMQLKTIFDNWYICSFSQDKACIRLFIPYDKHQAEDYLNFISDRVYNRICRSFEAFEFKDVQKRWVSTSDGFTLKDLKLNFPRNSSIMPSFSFWPQYKINNYIKELMAFNKKKNKRLFMEREI